MGSPWAIIKASCHITLRYNKYILKLKISKFYWAIAYFRSFLHKYVKVKIFSNVALFDSKAQ